MPLELTDTKKTVPLLECVLTNREPRSVNSFCTLWVVVVRSIRWKMGCRGESRVLRTFSRNILSSTTYPIIQVISHIFDWFRVPTTTHMSVWTTYKLKIILALSWTQQISVCQTWQIVVTSKEPRELSLIIKLITILLISEFALFFPERQICSHYF